MKVLQAAYRGVKAGNPDATVIGLGGSGPSDPWLFECLKLGGGRHCDAISFHGYGATIWSTVGGPERLIAVVRRIRQALRAAGTPDVQIWDTECGPSVMANFRKFRLLGGEATPLDAARMFPKSVAAARAAGLARVLYYSGHEKTHAGDGGAGMFLADLNHTVRAGVVPLAVATSLLEGRCYVRRVPHAKAPNLVDLQFTGRGGTVRMLWAAEGSLAAPLPADTRQIVSMWGRPIKPTGRQIRVDQNPVYVLLP
ncbi:MAG: hypothetical protein GX774_10910 [Armatimonadetes bacterium]|nr:hypothetical protein [Armatimonadota bacterium]